jgi:hypothetical protein
MSQFLTMQEVVEHYEKQADELAAQRQRKADVESRASAYDAFGGITADVLVESDTVYSLSLKEEQKRIGYEREDYVCTFDEVAPSWDEEVARSLTEQSEPTGFNGPEWKGICRKPNCKCKSRPRVENFAKTRKHSNGVNCFDIAVDGPEALVFTEENENGKLIRFWNTRDRNLAARIRYVNTPSHPASWRLEIWRNTRVDTLGYEASLGYAPIRKGRPWDGKQLVEHYVHRTVTEESELTIAKYVAVYFARFSS